jgi:hypothetical protein
MRAPRLPFHLAASVIMVSLLAAATTRAGDTIAPHAAQYRLSLHPNGAADVVAVKGRLEVRFEASCDGWRLEQSLGFRMVVEDGSGLEHLAYLVGFEENDGASFTFETHTWENRQLVEKVSGVVRKDPATGAVRVRYAAPEARAEALPAGTLFPGEHVRALLAAARAGERSTMRTVFDGSTADNPYEISAWIGNEHGPGSADPLALAGRRSWPVRLAYFTLDATEPRPDFEMSVRLFDNGVAGDMIYDYDDFGIDVTLETVELLPQPRCP